MRGGVFIERSVRAGDENPHDDSPWGPATQQLLEHRLRRWVNGLEIHVEEGGLILRGSVRSYYVKQLAQEIVMEATSVPILVNAITVGRR